MKNHRNRRPDIAGLDAQALRGNREGHGGKARQRSALRDAEWDADAG